MATKKVNIDIVAKDKTRQAMQSATHGVDGLKNSVFNLKNALIGLGAGVAIKSFVDVGKQIESLQVRLKFLFGTAEEGAKAFDAMAKFASKVPFSLEQIQQGSGVLAVVSKDADELAEILELTGNVAAVTGLDFRTTAEQIQRSLSAGISSADLFRERGVKAMLGFSAGATVSVEQTRDALFKTFGKDGQFAGATKDLANTLEGTLSMIGDKYFNFQKEVAEEFFVALKKEFGALDQALADNEALITDIARAIGKGLADAVTLASQSIVFFTENFETIKRLGMAAVIFTVTRRMLSLAIAIKKVGLAFLTLNKVAMRNFIGMLAAAGFIIADMTGKLDEFFALFEKPKTMQELGDELDLIVEQLGLLEDNGVKGFQRIHDEAIQFRNDLEALRMGVEEGSHEFQMLSNMINEVEQALHDVPLQTITIDVDEQTKKVGLLTQAYQKFKEGFMDALKDQKSAMEQIKDIGKATFGELKKTLTDFVMTGKLEFEDFARFVIKKFIEMLVGQAIQAAFQKSLKLFKMDAIKKAMISVFEGALKTFASIPFPFNIAAVGGAIAFGMSMVNKIRGFEKGGRPPVGQPSIVGESGPELFVPDQAGTVVPNNQLGMGKQVTVNFNINTVDARGFNELLVNSRGVIVNMINNAVNEKGKVAII